MSDLLQLNCLFWGRKLDQVFRVEIQRTADLATFKTAIGEYMKLCHDDFPISELGLYKIQIPISNDKTPPNPELRDAFKLDPANNIGQEFPEQPPRRYTHVVVSSKSDSVFFCL